MRLGAWLCLAWIGACTPLRPLDSELDARTSVDARGSDAASDGGSQADADLARVDAPGLDAARLDAPLPDAPAVDAWSADAPSFDAFLARDANCVPTGMEQCNNLADEDCDGAIDEAGAVGMRVWYPDADRDGYGTEAGAVTACREPADGMNYRDRGGDCDDTTREVRPGRIEQCNAIDDDCNGLLDDRDPCPAANGCTTEVRAGHTYQFCDGRLSWDEAAALCRGWGYHLVKIEDAAENDWVTSTAAGHGLGGLAGPAPGLCHIGLRRGATGFAWEDGTLATFTTWDAGEPSAVGGEDCVRIRSAVGRWGDYFCAEAYDFVCETP